MVWNCTVLWMAPSLAAAVTKYRHYAGKTSQSHRQLGDEGEVILMFDHGCRLSGFLLLLGERNTLTRT